MKLCLVMLLSFTVYAQDFRNSYWGDNIVKVRQNEKDMIFEKKFCDGSTLGGFSKIGGKDVGVVFNFVNGILVRGVYLFVEENKVNYNLYLNDYESISNLLKSKYGLPAGHLNKWSDELYKDDISKWGMAVAVGHLDMLEGFFVNITTAITHRLTGKNFEVTHYVEYESVQHFGEYMKSLSKERSKGL